MHIYSDQISRLLIDKIDYQASAVYYHPEKNVYCLTNKGQQATPVFRNGAITIEINSVPKGRFDGLVNSEILIDTIFGSIFIDVAAVSDISNDVGYVDKTPTVKTIVSFDFASSTFE
jgi:hypothetical protein